MDRRIERDELDGCPFLELGCGQMDKKPNGIKYVGLDRDDHGQAVVWDIEDGLPFPDDNFEKIYSSHTFEHLHPEKIPDVFNECWRILEKGGELYVVVPHRRSPQAYTPTHLTYFDEKTFQVFTEGHGDCYAPIKRWSIIDIRTNERGDIHCKLTPIK